MKNKYIGFLNGTALKIIALIAMTVDHLGMLIFTDLPVLRIIGRISFPIFAFMVAEGCRYTKNKLKYFLSVFILGLICQAVFVITNNSWLLNILLVLSLSIIIIYSFQFAKRKSKGWYALPIGLILLLIFGDLYLKSALPQTANYAIDYGVAGVLLPVGIHLFKKKWQKLLFMAVELVIVALFMKTRQYFALLAIIPLSFYNGKAGKKRFKYFFYLYYPLHLAVIYGISCIL